MNFIFRNSMLEIFFSNDAYTFSDYNSPLCEIDAENFLWMNFIEPSPDIESITNQIDELGNNLKIALKTSHNKPIYILGLFLPRLYQPLLLTEVSVIDKIHQFNKEIITLSEKSKNIFYLNPNDLLNCLEENYFSSKFFLSSSSIISPLNKKSFASWVEGVELLISKKRKKLLILDLDNTLWGGVIGESGYDGIKIGNTYPGNAYQFFQKKIKELSRNGVILAACSKNNIEDVEEGFLKNKNMILQLDDFSVIEANWDEKSTNIQKIISKINIGEDACVFIDDNPLERDMVKTNFPKIIVPELPEKAYELPKFINLISFKYFSSHQLTTEDLNKKKQYEIKFQAEKERETLDTKDEFLKNLNLEGIIPNDLNSLIPRISQMTQKTNQFNLTTERLDENEVKEILKNGNLIFPLQVIDKYGDHGITALLIVSKSKVKGEAHISNFLMSCRILGRDIEYEFLKWCLTSLSKKGISHISSKYIRTNKNNQVNQLYENAGFKLIKQNDKEKEYKINLHEWLKNNNIKDKYIKIKEA